MNGGADFGVTPNDLGDADVGGNDLQNFPLITAITPLPGHTLIGGSLNSHTNQAYTLDFYASPAGDVDPSGHGEARTYLGSTTITTFLEGNISFLFDYPGAVPLRNVITATATDAQGNTSEFALNFINNGLPVAHIHDPIDYFEVSEGAPVSFNATGSTDPDNDPLTYRWFFDDGVTSSGTHGVTRLQ